MKAVETHVNGFKRAMSGEGKQELIKLTFSLCLLASVKPGPLCYLIFGIEAYEFYFMAAD